MTDFIIIMLGLSSAGVFISKVLGIFFTDTAHYSDIYIFRMTMETIFYLAIAALCAIAFWHR